ncbi:MAG: SDR family NAD(P)-dependent oxidoreductase [Bryobacteraceae bacterium]
MAFLGWGMLQLARTRTSRTPDKHGARTRRRMAMRIEGKVAIITGASEGIGAACAAEFARAGARLSLCARSEEGLRCAGGGQALVTAGDLTDEAVRRRLVDRTLERFGAIDILINNAGIGLYIPSWEAPEAEVRRLMELNFFALLGLVQLVAPHMRARRSGTIVNVGSIGGKVVLPWMTVYSASKYAVGALTEGLRMELRRDGVRTMLVCPGYVLTEFQRHSVGDVPPAVVKGRRFAITAAQCAADIRRGVERDARTVMSPRVGWLMVALARMLPSAVDARMARMNGTA